MIMMMIMMVLNRQFGPLKWELVLCLAATWLLVILSLFKGGIISFLFKSGKNMITTLRPCLHQAQAIVSIDFLGLK